MLPKCIHCWGHSVGLTAAAYNHSVDRQRFESTSLVTLPVYVPFMLRLDGASMGGYSWLVRHARRARERLPTVLSACNHCLGHSAEPTAAAYSHSAGRQCLSGTRKHAVHALADGGTIEAPSASTGGYSWLIRQARRARERLPTRRSQIISL